MKQEQKTTLKKSVLTALVTAQLALSVLGLTLGLTSVHFFQTSDNIAKGAGYEEFNDEYRNDQNTDSPKSYKKSDFVKENAPEQYDEFNSNIKTGTVLLTSGLACGIAAVPVAVIQEAKSKQEELSK